MQEPDVIINSGQPPGYAQRAWQVAIATLPQLLQQTWAASDHPPESTQGVMLTGPMPVLADPQLLSHLQTWTFSSGTASAFQLPPCATETGHLPTQPVKPTIPLLPADPLTLEQFCVLLTPSFSWLALIATDEHDIPQFNFSFVPTTIAAGLDALKARVQLTRPDQCARLEQFLAQFPLRHPDYQVPMQFSRLLLNGLSQLSPVQAAASGSSHGARMERVSLPPKLVALHPPASAVPAMATSTAVKTNANLPTPEPLRGEPIGPDVEVLQAIAHEVSTPLPPIQTFTRLLLKGSDVPTDVLKRLEAIQRECRQQIDRFGLIFRAMELTHPDAQPIATPKTAICLRQLLNTNLSGWQQQAARRGLTLSLTVPPSLPTIVISDPTMLDQALTGLIDRLSHSLSTGSEIELQAALAGEQLKLELRSHPIASPPTTDDAHPPLLKAIGQLLMLAPETGGLSLHLAVTKHLFDLLGCKLTVRQHQQQGEILTIFLPLSPSGDAY